MTAFAEPTVPLALVTERLLLRMPTEYDWRPLHAYYGDGDSVLYTVGTPRSGVTAVLSDNSTLDTAAFVPVITESRSYLSAYTSIGHVRRGREVVERDLDVRRRVGPHVVHVVGQGRRSGTSSISVYALVVEFVMSVPDAETSISFAPEMLCVPSAVGISR